MHKPINETSINDIVKYNGKFYIHSGCQWQGWRQGDCILQDPNGIIKIPPETEVFVVKTAGALAMEYLEERNQ
jgi:hypothetical protein